MIRGGFLTAKERADLTALARSGLAEHRVARRANAVLLLDKGWSCQRVAEALLLDDDTVREWRDLFGASGVQGLSRFEVGGGASFLSAAQEAQLKAWIVETLPRTTRGGWGLYPAGVRRRIRKPLGSDQTAASVGPGISKAGSHRSQPRREQAKDVHRGL